MATKVFVFGENYKNYRRSGGLCTVYHGKSHPIFKLFPEAVEPDNANRVLYRVKDYFPNVTKPREFIVSSSIHQQLKTLPGLNFSEVYLGQRIHCPSAEKYITALDNEPVSAISMGFERAVLADQRRLRRSPVILWDSLEKADDRFYVHCPTVFDFEEISWPLNKGSISSDRPISHVAKELQSLIPGTVMDGVAAVRWQEVWIVREDFMDVLSPHIVKGLYNITTIDLG
jgi:hypothetical protein